MAGDSGRPYQPDSIGGTQVADVLGGGQELPLLGVDNGKRGPDPIGFNNRKVEPAHLEHSTVTADSPKSPREDGGGAPDARIDTQNTYETHAQETAATQGAPA